MKKFILSAVALLFVGGACCVNAQELTKEQKAALKAQEKELKGFLKEAKKNSQIGEGAKPNFDAARAALANAAKNPAAANNPEFFLQAAEVESNAFTVAAQANDLVNYANAATAGFDFYKKAYAAANGNKGLQQKIQAGALNIYQSTSGMQMVGNVFYQEKEWQKCLDAWNVAKTAHLEPMISENVMAKPIVEMNAADSVISNLYLNCFSVAQYMMQDTLAANKELMYLKDHPADETQLNQVLQALCLNYYGADDSLKFEQALREGVDRLPNETWYLNNLINVYIQAKRYDEASSFIDKAIASDPENPTLTFVKGNLLEQLGDAEGSFKCYEKALALDPSNAEINSAMGRFYYNKAQNVEEEYFQKKQFEKGDAAAAEFYDKALPFFEAAYAFDTDRKDKSIAIALRMLYGKKIAKGQKQYQSLRSEVSSAYGFE
ncbi:MAG: tetratricopeptide repeat protein [Bacteroidales bacterium]|nr:tetratricopeptide repeat protein [Bacteroidales bacterium]